MALPAFGTIGSQATGTTSLILAYPASIAAGDLLVVCVANKYPTNGPSTPSGFTLATNAQASGGAATDIVDTGHVYVTVFYKVADGSESGNLTVTVTSGNSSVGRIARYTCSAGTTWSIAAASGSFNSPSASWSVTCGTNPGITANDLIVAVSARNSDGRTFTAEAVAATGLTMGTAAERSDSGTSQGDDCGLVISDHAVTSGDASAAPVYTMTASGSDNTTEPAGATVLLRLRELSSDNGALNVTLDTMTVAGTGTVDVQGALTSTLDTMTVAGTGTVAVQGAEATTLAGDTLAGTATLLVLGTLAATLDTLTLVATSHDSAADGNAGGGGSGFTSASGWTGWLER